MIRSPLDSASEWLNWSNVLYVGGAALTLSAAMYVLYENRAIAAGKRVKYYLLSEFITALAAVASLIGTIGAIHFSNKVAQFKDADLATYQAKAKVQIAQAEKDAEIAKANAASAIQRSSVANQKAEDARYKADQTETTNSKLKSEIANHETAEARANTELAAQTEKVNQYARGVAVQQQGMAQQLQTTPAMNDQQISALAALLKPYAGQSITVHTVMDARSQRLAGQLIRAFNLAGIKVPRNTMDFGPDYRGVIVGFHDASPAPHPPLADAVLNGVMEVLGFTPKSAAFPNVAKQGEVVLLIGPE